MCQSRYNNPSTDLCVCPYNHQFIHQSTIKLSINQSVDSSPHVPAYPSICPSMHPSCYIFIYPFLRSMPHHTHPSLYPDTPHRYTHHLCLPVYPAIHVSVHIFIDLRPCATRDAADWVPQPSAPPAVAGKVAWILFASIRAANQFILLHISSAQQPHNYRKSPFFMGKLNINGHVQYLC